MKINFFNTSSTLYPFRWYIVVTVTVALFMFYHDISGGRMFAPKPDKDWNSSGYGSGSGYHK